MVPYNNCNYCVTVAAAGGELLGKDRSCGHGLLNHERVYEGAFVKGKLR
jgi:hypothetical protein